MKKIILILIFLLNIIVVYGGNETYYPQGGMYSFDLYNLPNKELGQSFNLNYTGISNPELNRVGLMICAYNYTNDEHYQEFYLTYNLYDDTQTKISTGTGFFNRSWNGTCNNSILLVNITKVNITNYKNYYLLVDVFPENNTFLPTIQECGGDCVYYEYGEQVIRNGTNISSYGIYYPETQADVPFTLIFKEFNISYGSSWNEDIPNIYQIDFNITKLLQEGGSLKTILYSYNPTGYFNLVQSFYNLVHSGKPKTFVKNTIQFLGAFINYVFRQPGSIVPNEVYAGTNS